MVMRGVMNQRGLHLDLAFPQVGSDAVQGQISPQSDGGHELIELLQFAEAGNVALAFGLSGAGDREATGPPEGRVLAQPLVNEFRFGRLPGKGRAEEAMKHGEETLGRSSFATKSAKETHEFTPSSGIYHALKTDS